MASGLLGFSSGFSFLLILSTLPVWLSEHGISKTTIGFFTSIALLPYALKILWAPIIDRLPLPVLTALLGHRRSWSFLTQLVLLWSVLQLGKLHPEENLPLCMFYVFLIVFASATRDLVNDAYRVETLDKKLLGAGSALYILGYRIGMLVSGAGALYVADHADWTQVFQVMGGCILVGILTILLVPEPNIAETDEMRFQQNQAKLFLDRWEGQHTRLHAFFARLYASIVCPFKEFMGRPGWLLILAFMLFFKLSDNFIHTMSNLFFLDIGFTKTEIAHVTKVFGLVAAIIGGLLGGMAMGRLGVLRSLFIFGIIHAMAHTLYILQTFIGYNIPFLYLTIALGNITGGMCTATFVAYLTSQCNKSYSMTQYALFSSIWSLGNIISASSGWIVDSTNWTTYFTFASLVSLPGLLLLSLLHRQSRRLPTL